MQEFMAKKRSQESGVRSQNVDSTASDCSRLPSTAPDFCAALRTWFEHHGRALPWRETADPYAVAVSEFMLQQTTVAAVVPYYHRWMKRWPTVASLAEASEHDVLLLWQGLGYYSRARNLLATARLVVERFGGIFPADPETLKTLPGFGDYTAGAVAAFAYDRPVVAIDANIARVLARLANVRIPVVAGKGRKLIEAWLREKITRNAPFRASVRVAAGNSRNTEKSGKSNDMNDSSFPSFPRLPSFPASRCGEAAQFPSPIGGRVLISALMDIGATICRSGVPRCDECPVRSFCTATNPAELPIKPPRREIIHLTDYRALIVKNGRVALCPAGNSGSAGRNGTRWRGLWVLPETEGRDADRILHTEKFSVTRHRITMHVVKRHARGGEQFFAPEDLPPMPAPHARVLDALTT